MALVNVSPAYSHGGSSSSAWQVIPGTSVSSGNPISLVAGGPIARGSLVLINKGSAAVTVAIEGSGGRLTNNNPPTDEWIIYPFCVNEVETQTITLAAGDTLAVPMNKMSADLPWIRTRITAVVAGCSLVSYVSLLYLQDGTPFSPTNPMVTNSAVEGM